MDKEIIKEEGDWRVTIERDEYADEPYDCGQPPLLRIETRYRTTAEHIMVGERPTTYDDRVEEAAIRWYQSGDHHLLEKYLRAFHGATVIKWYGPNNYTDYHYVVYDTPAWSESIGFDDKCAPRANYDAKTAVQMNEYTAYLEGEVYTYDVERRVKKIVIYCEKDGTEIRRTETDSWEPVDSCGGFYGEEWAKEAALEAFNDARNEPADA
jgi:hypothetical protein